MVNDYLLQERMLQLRHHRLFQPRVRDNPDYVDDEGRELRLDGYGPGARNTGVRLLGKPYRGKLHGVVSDDIRKAMVQLLRGVGPAGNAWPTTILQGWNAQLLEECTLELHSHASLGMPVKLDAAVKRRKDVDNSWFCVHMPRSEESKRDLTFPPNEIPEQERLSQTHIPRDLANLIFDYENLTVFCQVSVTGKCFAPCILACLNSGLAI